MDSKKLHHIYITKIRAIDVTCGRRGRPANLCVTVEWDGTITKTSIETVPLGNSIAEWNEQIPLPTDLSSNILFKVYASFQQMALKLGNGKLIGQCEISVGELLDRNERLETIKFPTSMDENTSSCSSLRITIERRTCDSNDECIPRLRKPNAKRQVEELIEEGDSALVRYHRYKSQVDLDKAIACFGLARHKCPNRHLMRSTAQFGLGNTMFIDCQANNYNFCLDVPIKLYRDALRLRARGDAAHAQITLQLCLALLVRFERRGDETDRGEVMDLLARLMKISPADGPIDQVGCRVPQMAEGSVSSQARDAKVSDDADLIDEVRAALCTLSRQDSLYPVILCELGKLLCRRFEDKGNLADIHEAISTLEEAVELIANGDSKKPGFLNYLGVSLRLRFERLGKTTDLDKSIVMLGEAHHLTPDGHPDKPFWLNSLGSVLFRRFERLGDLADITKSISILDQAVRLTPDGHADKPTRLNNLGNAFFRRFERLGDLADITKSISMFEQAFRLTPDGHPDKPALLNNLGNTLSCRFQRLGDLADITKSVSMYEQAVHLTPDGHPDKLGRLNNLGYVLSLRFEQGGDLADITKSISISEQAVYLAPDNHPGKPGWANNLGTALLRRFGHCGDLSDITKSVSMIEQAICLTPNGHPSRLSFLSNLANVLLSRFERLGDLADVTKSISMFEQAIRLTPDGHPDKPAWLHNLGNALLSRLRHLGDLADLTKSASMFEQAVRLTPDGHPDKPGRLNSLGNALSRRFEQLDDFADITRSVSMYEQAISLTPDGHPNKLDWLNNLGDVLSHRFQRFGDLADIPKSISMFEQAIRLTPDSYPDKPRQLHNLGKVLSFRFQRLGDLADITKSVSMFEQAVRLTPDGHPDKPYALNNLGNVLSLRFEQLSDLADNIKSGSMFEQAIRLTPDGHPSKPARLNNLGSALVRRSEKLGDLADFTKSVSMFEHANNLTPDGHPDKPSFLNSLGSALSLRFQHLGDLADITKSISMFEQAICLIPDGHPHKPDRLHNLGNALFRRFERFADFADITKSIATFEQAICLTPDGHPNKPALISNLGNSFMSRFNSFHQPSDLVTATFHFSAAAQSSTGPTTARFAAARRWIESAQLEGNSQTLIHACTVSLALLPQLAWMGLPLTERHRMLLGGVDVVRGAAAAALDAGLLDTAVEWLEQGRSIVWTQFLELRTSVDLLRLTHPALADDFEQTSKQLESASTRDHVLSAEVLVRDSWSQEEIVQRHHTLTLRREKLLADIRSLPGFDRFLLPKTIGQLTVLASRGPVVYLNASQGRCDALIVVAGRGNFIHVPLSNVTYRHVERMHQLLVERDRLTVPTDDFSLLTPSTERGAVHREGGPTEVEEILCDRFRLVLRFLWSNVVHPVLDSLAFSIPPSDTMVKMPRIFWCPTGSFAFLPIHAAGIYGTSPPGPKLSDFAISSYIPTLSALAPKTAKPPRSPSNIRLLIVPQPSTDGQPHLWGVNGEIDTIKALSDESQFVTTEDSDGTIEDVTQKMGYADWVHFACHGVQDSFQPLDSGLCLANDRRLRLSDIIKSSRRSGGLAFLSACQTAKGEEKLPEESVHLAAGMLLAGYDGVIATMWSIMDNDAPKVTRDVYKYLFRHGKVPDTKEAAEALHHAVVRLRDEDKVSFSSWVPFIHIGR